MNYFDKKRLEKEVFDRKTSVLVFFLLAGFLMLVPLVGAPAFDGVDDYVNVTGNGWNIYEEK